MDLGFTTAVYVIAAILFILSLGGLSGQESAKRAVWFGIFGMALAILQPLLDLARVFAAHNRSYFGRGSNRLSTRLKS